MVEELDLDLFQNLFKGSLNDISENMFPSEIQPFAAAAELLNGLRGEGGQCYIIGNGGSASIAAHVSVDFCKIARIPTRTFNESNFLTCVSNDYGYERVFEVGIDWFANPNDLVIAISSSGESENIIKAVSFAKTKGLRTISFSGFGDTNRLRQLAHINFWVDSSDYNTVEMIHHIWLVRLGDVLSKMNNDEG